MTSNKQINEVRKSIQDLDNKVSNVEKKFSKEVEIMKNSHVEMLEISPPINQIKTIMDSIINKQDQTEERMSGMEDNLKEILHMDNHKQNKGI
jgi:Fic family protein